MKDYSDIGLTRRFRAITSIPERQPKVVVGVDFESQYDVQAP